MRKLVLYGLLGGALVLALALEHFYIGDPERTPPGRLVLNMGGDGVVTIPERPPLKRQEVDSPPPERPAPAAPRASPAAAPRKQPPPQPVARTYRVQAGETLSEIARRELGDAQRWREIQKLNKIDDPRRVRPGEVLRLPER